MHRFITCFCLLITIVASHYSVAQDSSWVEMARLGDVKSIEHWVDTGGDVNIRDKNGVPLLMWAAVSGNVELLRFVIEEGGDPTQKGAMWHSEEDSGFPGSLLGIATYYGHMEALRYFVEEVEIPIEDRDLVKETGEGTGWRALQWAAFLGHQEILTYLLEAGAQPNYVGDEQSPLLLAAQRGNEIVVDLLLWSGASVQEIDREGRTIIHFLSSQGNATTLTTLLSQDIDLNAVAKNGYTPLMLAAQAGEETTVRLLLCRGAVGLEEAKEIAEKAGHPFVKKVLESSSCEEEVLEQLLKAERLIKEISELYRTGRYAEVAAQAEEIVRLQRSALGDTHPEYAASLNYLGELYKWQGRIEEAEIYFIEAMDAIEASLGKSTPHYATVLENLGLLYAEEDWIEEAEKLLKEALSIIENSLGKSHPRYVQSQKKLAELYITDYAYKKAERVLRKALKSVENTFGKSHPLYSETLIDLGRVYMMREEFEKAASLYKDALQIDISVLGDRHPRVGKVLSNLGELYAWQGQYSKAKPFFLEAMSIIKKSFGDLHPEYMYRLNDLAKVNWALGRFEEADSLFRMALVTQKELYTETDPNYNERLNELARLYDSGGHYIEAESFYREAMDLSLSEVETLLVETQNPQLVTALGHSDDVLNVSFSEDGSLAFSGGKDGLAIIWDASSGTELQRIQGHISKSGWQQFRDGKFRTSTQFSSNGKYILTGNAPIILWDISSGLEVRRFYGEMPAVFSPDGKYIVTSRNGGIILWETETGNLVRRFDIASSLQSNATQRFDTPNSLYLPEVNTVAFSPDGRYLLSSYSAEGEVVVWDTTTGSVVGRFSLESYDDGSAAFGPEGRMLFVGGEETQVVKWDIKAGKKVQSFRFQGLVAQEDISPDGRFILSVEEDEDYRKVVSVWDTVNGDKVLTVDPYMPSSFLRPAFSPDSENLLVCRNSSCQLWNIPGQHLVQEFSTHSGTVTSIDFSEDGRYLITGSEDDKARIWDVGSGEVMRELTRKVSTKYPVLFSNQDLYLFSDQAENQVQIWDLYKGAKIQLLSSPKSDPEEERQYYLTRELRTELGEIFGGGTGRHKERAPAYVSSDARFVLTTDAPVRLWDIKQGKEIKRFDGILPASFSKDGSYVYTTSPTGIQLWDAVSGAEVQYFSNPAEYALVLQAAAISPDGRYIVGGYSNIDRGSGTSPTVRMWDTQSGDEYWNFGRRALTTHAVSFSSDGAFLATGDDRGACIWNVETRSQDRCFDEEVRSVLSVAFSPNNEVLAVGGRDGHVRLWGTLSGKLISLLRGHNDVVSEIGFSADGQFIISNSDDGTSILWDVASSEERVRIVQLAGGSWATVSSEGYFDTNNLEDIEALHWVMPDAPLTPLPLEIFMRNYFEPQLLPRIINGEPLPEVPDLTTLNRSQPLIHIDSISLPTDSTALVTLEVQNVTRSFGLNTWVSGAQNVHLFRDGQQVGYLDGSVSFSSDSTSSFTLGPIQLPRSQDSVTFSAYAFNEDNVKSLTVDTTITIPTQHAKHRARAYIISFGVDHFSDPDWNLSFAANDARAMASRLVSAMQNVQSNSTLPHYEDVVDLLLVSDSTSSNATLSILEGALALLRGEVVNDSIYAQIPNADRIKKAHPDDVVVISFSTHGFSDTDGVFYLFPQEIGSTLLPDSVQSRRKQFISSDQITEWLRGVDAGALALIVDACYAARSVEGSGFKAGPMGSRGFGQLAYNKGMLVLAASQSDDVALEHSSIRQGLLSYVLTQEAFDPERDADINGNGLTLLEWLTFGERRVPSLFQEVVNGEYATKGAITLFRAKIGQRKKGYVQTPKLFNFARMSDSVPISATHQN